jgi:hypothetical protein
VQIDRARIAIRERTWLDNLDLALQVIRTNFAGVTAAALAGVLPMILINWAIVEFLFGEQLSEGADSDAMLLGTLLVMIQAPLATAPLTLYLGQALFVARPSGKRIAQDLWSCLPQLLLFQVVLRTVLILPILTWIVPYGLWPYLNEVILLERNPLTARGGQLSTLNRNALLHRSGGDYLLHAVGAGVISLLLISALWVTQAQLGEMLLGIEEGWTAQILTFQCALWIVAVYFTVARFLSYLDQRIRSEGWEVELCLRAQRDRLTRQAA